jgi:hypothetical protein
MNQYQCYNCCNGTSFFICLHSSTSKRKVIWDVLTPQLHFRVRFHNTGTRRLTNGRSFLSLKKIYEEGPITMWHISFVAWEALHCINTRLHILRYQSE